MKKLIFNSLCYIEGQSKPVNLSKQDNIIELYLKCSIVSLVSAKLNNSECDVALITNINIPDKFEDMLKRYNIKIIHTPFEYFNFDKKMKWSSAFYKLCALKYAVENLEYDKYLILDTDTYVNGNINDLWLECNENVMLFDIQHSLSNKQAIQINKEYKDLYNKETFLTNYGGEFIAGSKALLKEFISQCEIVYEHMINKNKQTLHGDEFIICCAAKHRADIIKSANAYIYRFWTGRKFYLVSTNYRFNKISILHLPAEKGYGFIDVYNYILKKGKLPNETKLIKVFGLPKTKRTINISYLCQRINKKFKHNIKRGKI